ncbi:transposable element Tcb1 transposase [Trichonephila clavipes]|nr:transposable element Tcb1 transposase [Trichonephila clavipes]
MRRHLAEGHLESRRPLRVLLLSPPIDAFIGSGATHEETRLQRNGTRSSLATRESRFNLSSDDNRVRVSRPRRESLNPGFALQRHTILIAGAMIWGVIAYNTRSP